MTGTGPNQFGINWGGQREIVDRLLLGYDARLTDLVKSTLNPQPAQLQALQQALTALNMPTPVAVLALQDCVDMAIFFIRTTIAAQAFTVGIRGCGGPIDVAIITRDKGLQFVQRKKITGETAGQ